jgi:SAM-dependent methyltransferase
LSYAFGHSPLAGRRLEVVARVFEPATRAFLLGLDLPGRDLAVDLGCGPGYSTRLLEEILRSKRTAGLDLSSGFIEHARAHASERLSFHVHDVTVVPFPTGQASLLYCRFLLTHLRDPFRVIESWATQLVSRGLLVLDEVESIETSSPVLARYLEIVDQMLKSQSNRLYIGSDLEGVDVSPYLEKRTSALREFPVSISDAATMFSMNLGIWREHPFVREHVEESEMGQLERDLSALGTNTPRGVEIIWRLRQITYERT